MNDSVVMQIENLCKEFCGVKVLKNINFVLREGEILGLVGENGAGKSTLLNVIGGVHPTTSGSITLYGQKYEPHEPKDATKAKIAFIHQELNLFTNLTVAENIFVDDVKSGRFLFDEKVSNKRAKDILDFLGVDLSPTEKVENLTMGMRQIVEIAKAVSKNAKVIFFDEPTTSLSNIEKENLFALICEFSRKGISMIFISHALDDVLRLCDEVLVIRDGEAVGKQESVSLLTKDTLIKRMVGREMGQIYPYITKNVGGNILSLEALSSTGVFENINIEAKSGEIVGLFGLMGAGRTELARAVYGIDPFSNGQITYKGKKVDSPSPGYWVKERVAFITENRRDEGLLLSKNITDNIELVNLPNITGRLGVLDRNQQAENTKRIIEYLKIKVSDEKKQVACNLSGGNQQKVVIGKWLLIEPELFILDEPTRGVDVGAKFEIYSQINQLALSGSAVIFISSEMEELMGICDRIIVLHRGKVTGEIKRDDFTSNSLMKLALGEIQYEN